MKVCFHFGFKGKAIAFNLTVHDHGARKCKQCYIVANTAIKDFENCCKAAQKDAGVTDALVAEAKDSIRHKSEEIELTVIPNKNGACDCTLYWRTRESWDSTPKMHNQTQTIANTLYEILVGIRALGAKEPNPKWLKNITITKANF